MLNNFSFLLEFSLTYFSWILDVNRFQIWKKISKKYIYFLDNIWKKEIQYFFQKKTCAEYYIIEGSSTNFQVKPIKSSKYKHRWPAKSFPLALRPWPAPHPNLIFRRPINRDTFKLWADSGRFIHLDFWANYYFTPTAHTTL